MAEKTKKKTIKYWNELSDMSRKRALQFVFPIHPAIVEMLMNEKLREVLNTLSSREKRVIELRFGLADGKQWTLEEVGREFHVTRERIRQIEAKALAKLRKNKDTKKLHEYLK